MFKWLKFPEHPFFPNMIIVPERHGARCLSLGTLFWCCAILGPSKGFISSAIGSHPKRTTMRCTSGGLGLDELLQKMGEEEDRDKRLLMMQMMRIALEKEVILKEMEKEVLKKNQLNNELLSLKGELTARHLLERCVHKIMRSVSVCEGTACPAVPPTLSKSSSVPGERATHVVRPPDWSATRELTKYRVNSGERLITQNQNDPTKRYANPQKGPINPLNKLQRKLKETSKRTTNRRNVPNPKSNRKRHLHANSNRRLINPNLPLRGLTSYRMGKIQRKD